MQPKVAIILVNYNGKDDTLECLESLQHIDYKNFEIIVVDNGSKESLVKEVSPKYPDVKIIETKENLGFSEGNNVGIRYALEKGHDFYFLLNNDTIVDKNLITELVKAAKKNPLGGVFGAKIFRYHDPSTIDHFGGVWNLNTVQFDSIGCGQKDEGFDQCRTVDYVCGCAFFIRKKVIEKIGGLEPSYFLIWEEADYCYQAKKVGFSSISVPQAKVYHKVSSSFTGGKPQLEYFWWRNRLLWLQRNGIMIPPYKKALLFQHLKVLRHFLLKALLLPFSLPSNKKIRLAKARRYKAKVRGIFDYYRGKFGNTY